ncbi:organic hydroperoxide resistance protein [Mycolicibacterium neoaurum]|uniref:organic hydroperoxide resistance protein n=1 Tax=Mycolicibacterium neoaurum TaxID=1795 RepID=UPI00248CB7DF|nr:organic hydroperoxide resistance protein [Mycolicibacterium neoaurum]WBP93712.1 organic hydroperoxide resistance protein [Mycolicibacterium neoaurum]WBS07511.1 organic hydroperoxide resistance protein [Mycolicibacterium neoaurum]
MSVVYTAATHTTGGRQGESYSSDGNLDIQLTAPGAEGTGTNPEQLFAAGWSACYLSAMGLVAGQHKVKLPAQTAVDAEVDLVNADGGFSLQARLNVSIPGVDPETARQIVDGAHEVCPYSKATRGNIPVTINLV